MIHIYYYLFIYLQSSRGTGIYHPLLTMTQFLRLMLAVLLLIDSISGNKTWDWFIRTRIVLYYNQGEHVYFNKPQYN